MSLGYIIKMYDLENGSHTENNCLYFRFVKELYTPYVYFEGKFISSVLGVRKYGRVEFILNGKVMHVGLVDSINVNQKNNKCTVTVKSKGFTSLLCQNQPTPGLMTDVNLGKVISSCPTIPYVTWEESKTENYIYIKDGSTVWDAICNLAYRQQIFYPYIYGTNDVRISKRRPSRELYIRDDSIIESGVIHDSTRIISDIHMQDTEGNYDVFEKTNQIAIERNIVRHKQIPLDRQFLYNPEEALNYRFCYSMRGCMCNYVRYVGYNYEDLFDLMNYRDVSRRFIHRIEILFNGINCITTLGTYTDGFVTV